MSIVTGELDILRSIVSVLPHTEQDTGLISLGEFESCKIELSRQTHTILTQRYKGRLDIAHTGRDGVYRLSARDYVGRVSLPDGRLLVIRPKVGVFNLFHMLCVDAGLVDFHPPPTGLSADTEIFPFVAAAFLTEIEKLLRGGLLTGYLSVERDLALVRGRINISQQLRLHADLKHRHVCHYAESTHDIPENRVLASTIAYIPHLLEPQFATGHFRRARSLLRWFEGVTLLRPAVALEQLHRISSHRLNARYEPALGLCRLLLNHLTLDERQGSHRFASFLVNMPRLFEGFITEKLRRALPEWGLRVVAQKHDYLDEERRIGIRPDVLVCKHGSPVPLLVLDAKYRLLEEGDINRDLYQVNAYLDRYSLGAGMLVYPRLLAEARTGFKLRNTPKKLHIVTLDLDASGAEQLDERCRSLAAHVAGLALGEKRPG